MTASEDRWLDELDRKLYTMMQQCPLGKKYQELYMALQRARSVSFSMLPKDRKKEFSKAEGK